MQNYFKVTTIGLICAGLSACAVTPGKIAAQAETKATDISALQTAGAIQKTQEPPLMRIKGNFLGSVAQTLNVSYSLPARFRDVTLNFGSGTGTLAVVAQNLRAATGLGVRINSDVFPAVRTGTAAESSNSANLANLGAGTLAAPNASQFKAGVAGLPTPSAVGVNGLAQQGQQGAWNANFINNTSTTQSAAPVGPQLPLSFKGNLGDYLNQISSAVGVQWEYVDGGIHFYKLVTRMFSVMVSPGNIAYKDEMNGGGSSSAGSTGGASSSSGSFGSTNSTSVAASYDPWASINEALKTLSTSVGRWSISQSSGTVAVTDTKDAVDRISTWIDHENAVLKTQISVDVREITVSIDEATQMGLDLNLVYQKLNAVSGASDWAFKFSNPSTLTDGTTGSIGYNVTRANSSLAGSAVAVQALNTFGQVVSNSSTTVLTTNRVPGRIQSLTEQAYLASTTPAAAGSGTSGSGVPGLTPGVVTYGSNMSIVPTIGENNTVLLQLFDTQSTLLGISSVGTGSGATAQLINTPTLQKRKFAQNFVVGQGETLMIVGSSSDGWTGGSAVGITGGSNTGKHTRTMQVLMITPRILQGT